MKTKLFPALFLLFILIPSFSALAQKSNFSGEWKLNREKTALGDNQLFLAGMTVLIKGDSLLTRRVYENANGEQYPFAENVKLDGKDCKIVIFDMPRATKASVIASDGSLKVESKTTFYGNGGEDNLIAMETWKVAADGKSLSIDFSNKMAAGESTGTLYFNKIK